MRETLTSELTDRLLLLIRAGNTIDVAAHCIGLSRATLYRRLARDPELAAELELARAQASISELGVLWAAARRGSWKAAARILERRYPERWLRVSQRPEPAEPVGSDLPPWAA